MPNKPKQALGRGLESLFDAGFENIFLDESEKVVDLNLELVVARKDQPRKVFDTKSIQELAKSIKSNGLLQPIIVQKINEKQYEIIAGERRFRAFQELNKKTIPVIIRNISESSKYELALVENIQRVNLGPIEQAQAIENLRVKFQLEYIEIANRIGKSSSAVSNLVRLLKLPEEIIEALAKGTISEGHARSLLSVQQSPKDQIAIFEKIIKDKISVRATEILTSKAKNKLGVVIKKDSKQNKLTTSRSDLLKRNVEIISGRNKTGKIVIKYSNEADYLKIQNYLKIL